MAKNETMKLVANNKKAYHDYFIEEKYECGIALHGTEVKSLRMGKCSIKEAFIRIENAELFVYGIKNGEAYLYTGCISALMKKEIFLTKTHCV